MTEGQEIPQIKKTLKDRVEAGRLSKAKAIIEESPLGLTDEVKDKIIQKTGRSVEEIIATVKK